MDMTDDVDWQSYSYTFPPNLYLMLAPIMTDAESWFLKALKPAAKNETEVKKLFQSYRRFVAKESIKYQVKLEPFVVLLKFGETIALSQEMWSATGVKYDDVKRNMDLVLSSSRPTLHRYLVVPSWRSKTKETIEVVMPMPATTKAEEMSVILRNLHYQVDQTATHAAIYEGIRSNWGPDCR